jgi:hypothetical protein
MAQSRRLEMSAYLSAFGGEADMSRTRAADRSVATDPRADIGWIEIPQRSSPCRTEIVLPFRSDTPEGPTVHHRADGRPDILHGAIVGDGRETWQSRLSGSGRFRLPGFIP